MSKRLFVGNLSFQTTEAGLSAIFAQEGRQVSTVTLVLDRDTGRSRGFAFVEMATDADAQKAIKSLDGTQLEGRALKVDIAAERKPRTGGFDRRE
jgi:RNA recognition motif-containing protein